MARLRYNGLVAELGAALASGDTTITFAAALTHAGGAVPTITGTDIIALSILDTSGALVEIVSLTAYTSGATTGTITRAQESTTAAAHALGAPVVHAPTAADFAASGSTFIGCKAVRSTVQSLPNNTDVKVSFTSADEFDTDSMHDPAGANPTRVTVPTTGVYRVTGQVYWASNPGGLRYTNVAKNGTAIALGQAGSRLAAINGVFWQNFAIELSLVAGDYLELIVNQDCGVALDLNYASMSVSLA